MAIYFSHELKIGELVPDFTLLALDGEETFEVDAELEAVLLASIAQERGETIPAAELLREMRSRE